MGMEQYRIIRQIGEGGFGRIFQAEHRDLGELACIKQNISTDASTIERLTAEARLLWRLSEHHSIPHCKDFFRVEKGSHAMVMSYIDGKTLDDVVKAGRIHPEDVCWIAERLLGALHYCHYNGVIHSDVKPGNVFVEPAKHDIKLIDFGLAVERPTGKTAPHGYTECYAAPELIAGKPPLPQSDLYGVGMCMIAALGGDTAAKRVPDDIDPRLRSFIGDLVRYDPLDRPSIDDRLYQRLSDTRLALFGRRHTSG